jgi:hypothetical protein
MAEWDTGSADSFLSHTKVIMAHESTNTHYKNRRFVERGVFYKARAEIVRRLPAGNDMNRRGHCWDPLSDNGL